LDGRTLFWMADATGHGAAAALLTTLAKLLFHHGTVEHKAPVPIMQAVNADFRSIFGARSFMTAMCVALDPKTGRASIVGAGHPPLLVLRHDGARELIESCAPPLGLAARAHFVKSIVNLGPGDTFVLYTDGLYGGSNGAKSRLTPSQLAEKLDPSAPTAEAQLRHLLNVATPIKDNGFLPDDMAAVVIRRKK
jgi:sigma-B regulation protein RsbU (phosphoserine phosphatase)